MLRWIASSPYSERAAGAPYAVSRAQVLCTQTGELMERFSAWYGEALEVGRRDIQMPHLIGVFAAASAARLACEEHARDG